MRRDSHESAKLDWLRSNCDPVGWHFISSHRALCSRSSTKLPLRSLVIGRGFGEDTGTRRVSAARPEDKTRLRKLDFLCPSSLANRSTNEWLALYLKNKGRTWLGNVALCLAVHDGPLRAYNISSRLTSPPTSSRPASVPQKPSFDTLIPLHQIRKNRSSSIKHHAYITYTAYADRARAWSTHTSLANCLKTGLLSRFQAHRLTQTHSSSSCSPSTYSTLRSAYY